MAVVLSALVFAWLVSDQSLDLFRSVPGSEFYDLQARALLHGHWNVPAVPLWIEGVRIDGKTYMYYGPFLALLRIPVLLFTHRFDGRLSEVSMLLGFVVGLAAVSRLSWKFRLLIRGRGEVGWTEAVVAGAWTALIGLGSVLLYLGSNITVYYETELWGAVLALCAFDAIVGFVIRPSAWRIVAAGVFATLDIMTRGSVGAGPVAALGLLALGNGAVALARWSRAGRPSRWRRRLGRSADVPGKLARAGLEPSDRWDGLGVGATPSYRFRFVGFALAALIPAACYAVVNEIKFHTLFSIPFRDQAASFDNPTRLAVLAENHGSLFGPEYIPTSLLAYFRPDALGFTRLFPFLRFPGPATIVGHVAYDTRDWYSSVTDTMPLLLLGAIIGLIAVFRPSGGWRRSVTRTQALHQPNPSRPSVGISPGPAGARMVVLGAAIGTIGVLTISYIAIRYLADIVPLLVLLCLVGFQVILHRMETMRRWVRSLLWTMATVLAIFGIWVNLGLALVYQHELEPNIPTSTRAQFVSLQTQVDSALLGSHPPPVSTGSSLPPVAAPGSLAIVGSCAGLYQSDGTQWYGVEVGAKGGGIGLEITFAPGRPGSREPVVQVGTRSGGDVLDIQYMSVQNTSGQMVRFSYRSLLPGQPWFNGATFRVLWGRTYQVTTSFDARVGQVNAAVNGMTQLALISTYLFSYRVKAPTSVVLGTSAGIAGSSTRFRGAIRRVPVSTPICTSLLSRSARHRPKA